MDAATAAAAAAIVALGPAAVSRETIACTKERPRRRLAIVHARHDIAADYNARRRHVISEKRVIIITIITRYCYIPLSAVH